MVGVPLSLSSLEWLVKQRTHTLEDGVFHSTLGVSWTSSNTWHKLVDSGARTHLLQIISLKNWLHVALILANRRLQHTGSPRCQPPCFRSLSPRTPQAAQPSPLQTTAKLAFLGFTATNSLLYIKPFKLSAMICCFALPPAPLQAAAPPAPGSIWPARGLTSN